MTEGDAAFGAVKETTVFLSHFRDLPDYRQKGKVAYPLDEVLVLMLSAALGGAETVADIARFGRAKLAFLQRFRLFANGTPSHDQLGIILAKLDPVAFQRCFAAWTAALTKTSGELIAIDGKTVRRSYQKKGPKSPFTSSRPSPRASAWCSGNAAKTTRSASLDFEFHRAWNVSPRPIAYRDRGPAPTSSMSSVDQRTTMMFLGTGPRRL